MGQDPSAADFQDLIHGNWKANMLNKDHIIIVNEHFPAQVDIMLDHYKDDQAWHISLYVYNPRYELMDLLSDEYSTILPHDDIEGVREKISAYMDAIESGDLDAYKIESSA